MSNAPAPNQQPNPRLLELQGMFPGVEAAVVQAVWEAHSGEGESEEGWGRAVEDLLQLSDPEYKPEPRPAAHHIDAQTQTALDEEFARTLSMGNEPHPNLPYQPRSRRPHPAYQPDPQSQFQTPESTYAYRGGDAAGYHPPSSEGPGIEDKIEKLAQVGKQKFDLFLKSAKEKYADMSEAAAQVQQQRAQQQQQAQAQGQGLANVRGHGDNPPQGLGYELANTLGGLWTGATAAVARTTAQQPRQGGTGAGEPLPAWNDQAAKLTAGLGNAASGLKGWFDRAAGPKPAGQEYPSMESTSARQGPQTSRRWQPTDVYDAESDPRSINVYHPSSSASSASSLPSTSDDDDAVALDAKDSTPRATSHLAGGVSHGSAVPPPSKIDLSKIGMLPKKKVSLLPSPEAGASTSTLTGPTAVAPAQGSKAKQLDEEEEQEYTKNPFEER